MIDRRDRPTIEELRAKHGEHWGISQEKPRRNPADRERLMRKIQERDEAAILAEYARLGRQPVYAGGILLSPGLVEHVNPSWRDRRESSDGGEAA